MGIRSLFPIKMRCTIFSLLLWVASAFRLDDGTLQKEKDLTELRTLERGQREASGFGKILVVGGRHGDNRINTVTLVDPDNNFATCQLTAYPVAVSSLAGGLVDTENGPRPLVCGGEDGSNRLDQCRLLGQTWEPIHTLSTGD